MSTIDDIIGDALNDPHIFDFLSPPPQVTPRKVSKIELNSNLIPSKLFLNACK